MDWSLVLGVGLFRSGVQLAMPTALAAVGESFSERAGVLNLGLEGMMLCAALAAFVGEYYTGSAALGVLAGVAVGVMLAALKAFLSVYLKTEQVINGIAIVIASTQIRDFLGLRIATLAKRDSSIMSQG